MTTTDKPMEAPVEFDFGTAFISVQSQENGSEFEVLSDQDQPTGFHICLAGPDSTRRKRVKARLTDFFMKSGIGTPKPEPKNRRQRRALAVSGPEDRYAGDTSLELAALQMDDMVAATISWRYPEGFIGPECNEANVRHLYSIHPTLYEQVQIAAEDLDRFTKR